MNSAVTGSRPGGLRPGRETARVAIAGNAELDTRMLALAAAAVAMRLADEPGRTWGVYVGSPFLQLAVLTALQSLDRRAVLLPHVQPEFLQATRARFDGLLTDQPVTVDSAVCLPALPVLIAEGEARGALVCDWRQPIGLLTSGSSGEPTCAWKSPEQIASEIAMLEQAFGARIGRDRIFHGTTSHQHLYGFTFRVMWPFLTGRTLSDGQIRIPGDVSLAVRAHGRIVLISSPAFLSRARQIFDLAELGRAQLFAFSSGGPLDGATAVCFNQTSGVSLVEIYGSTETGALALRQTVACADTPWQPLPGVEVEIVDGLVTARGPHFSCDRRLVTADRAETVAGGFLLKGRADQIVKVADKRVSLNELERLLLERPEVAEARVLQLDDGSLGALVVPAENAHWEDITRRGKGAFTHTLRDHLAQHVDRVTTPRRWRLVKSIPRNPQGKVELNALRRRFAPPAEGHLDWQTVGADAGTWIARAVVPADLPELDGHFPGEPIVPGVGQLHWAALAARQHLGVDNLSGGMENVKFRSPILPGCTVTLTLRLDRSAGKVEFELRRDDQVYSSGRLLLERP